MQQFHFKLHTKIHSKYYKGTHMHVSKIHCSASYLMETVFILLWNFRLFLSATDCKFHLNFCICVPIFLVCNVKSSTLIYISWEPKLGAMVMANVAPDMDVSLSCLTLPPFICAGPHPALGVLGDVSQSSQCERGLHAPLRAAWPLGGAVVYPDWSEEFVVLSCYTGESWIHAHFPILLPLLCHQLKSGFKKGRLGIM